LRGFGLRIKSNKVIRSADYTEIGLKTIVGKNISNNFPVHTHESYIIGLLTSGATYCYTLRGTALLTAGDIYLINAREPLSFQNPNSGVYDYLTFCCSKRLLTNIFAPKSEVNQSPLSLYFIDIKLKDAQLFDTLLQTYRLLQKKSTPEAKQTSINTALDELIKHCNVTFFPEVIKNKAQLFIEQNPQLNLSLTELAKIANLSPYHFLRQFKKEVGVSPYQYQLQLRIKVAQSLLQQNYSIAEVALETGFTDQSHFTRFFRKHVGINPGEYINCNR